MSTIYKFQKFTGRFSNVLGTFTNEFGTYGKRFHNVFITNLNVVVILRFFFRNLSKKYCDAGRTMITFEERAVNDLNFPLTSSERI